MDRILGIGNALVDVITMIESDYLLEKFSLPKGSMQLVDGEKSAFIKSETTHLKRVLASGGSAANTIHGLAMLGAETGFIGSVGFDETGDFFENDMKEAGTVTYLIRRNSVTGTAVALISPDFERTFATHLGAAVELTSTDLKIEDFRGYDILYLEGYLIINRELVERACILARKNNMKIAIDLASYNVVEAKHQDFSEIIKKYGDIIFANEDEARTFTGLPPQEALNELSLLCEVAIVKIGNEGSLIKRGEEIIKIGAISVNCIDTTGAGDLYSSGFLYGYAQGLSLDKCGLFGSVLAGNVIETIGAKIELPRWSLIKSSLNDHLFID